MEIWAPLSPVWLGGSVGGLLVASYWIAGATLRRHGTALRLCGTYALCLWAMIVLFFLLSATHQFLAVPTLLIGLLGGALVVVPRARRHAFATQVGADARAVAIAWRSLDRFNRVLLGCSLVLVGGLMVTRTLVSPPLGWDDMTYHLFKSGTWVGSGGFSSQPAPDAWSYYDYFPASGEVVWAWFLLPARSGTFLGIGGFLAWLGAVGGGYASARSLGCDRDRSVTAALAIGSVGATALYVEISNVDTLALSGFLTGFAFLVACHRRFGWWPAAVSLAGFSVAAGSKTSGLTALGLAAVWLAVLAWRAAPPRRLANVLALAGIALVTTLAAAPWYLRAWLERGSPFYPVAVPVIRDHLPANEQLTRLLTGELVPGTPSQGVVVAALSIVLAVSSYQTGWQPGPVIWMIAAVAGAVHAIRARLALGPTAFLVLCSAGALLEVVSPTSAGLRYLFPDSLPRLLLPVYASCVLLAMRLPWRRFLGLAQILVALQLAVTAVAFARSWGRVDLATLGVWAMNGAAAAVIAIALAIGAVAGRRLARRTRIALAAAALVIVLLVLGAPLDSARQQQRYPIYNASSRTEQEETSRVQPSGSNTCPAPLWAAVDGPEGHVVAVTAAFGGVGHYNHRYPFLGSRLLNSVIYVPITRDGSIVDYQDPRAGDLMDEQAWLERVRQSGAEYVATLAVGTRLPPESTVIARHPDLFEPVARSTCDASTLYRVHRDQKT